MNLFQRLFQNVSGSKQAAKTSSAVRQVQKERFSPRTQFKVAVDAIDLQAEIEKSEMGANRESGLVDAANEKTIEIDPLGRKVVISTIEEFSTLPLLFESLVEDLNLGSHLGYNIQPALFGGVRGSPKARIALIVNSAYATSDEVVEILNKIKTELSKEFVLWEHASRIVVSHGLMLALTRGEIGKDLLSNTRKINADPKKHSFYVALEKIVEWGVMNNASDIHYNLDFSQETSEIRFTIDSRYVAPAEFRMPTQTLFQILSVAWMSGTGGNGPSYDIRIEQQCRIALMIAEKPIMLRWASASTESPGPSVTTRIIKSDAKMLSLADLSYLPDQIATYQRAMNAEKGAIILAGVVNSGKSVTIATLMSSIPDYRKKIGIEDPVEILIPGMLQKSINRPLEGDTGREFDAIAKTIKRYAMNDVLIGEIRDAPTGMLLADIVLMGTSVYTTTHAPTALGVFDKLSSDMVGVSRDFLSVPGNIKLITYQALLPKLCTCALPILELTKQGGNLYSTSGAKYINRLQALYDLDESRIKIRNPMGCIRCRRDSLPELNGMKGRTLAGEMVEPDETLLSMVKKADSLNMRRHVAELRGSTRFDDPLMVGKSAMENAVYKMSIGVLDPREIEPRFHSFEREEMIRESSRKYAEHVDRQVVTALRIGR